MTTWLEGLSYAFMGSKFPDWSVGNQVTIREYRTDTGLASSPVVEFYYKVVRKTAQVGYFDRSDTCLEFKGGAIVWQNRKFQKWPFWLIIMFLTFVLLTQPCIHSTNHGNFQDAAA